jgi:hypothetical protein
MDEEHVGDAKITLYMCDNDTYGLKEGHQNPEGHHASC